MTTRRTLMKSAVLAVGFAAAGLNIAVAEELQALKEKGVMRIAMTGAYPPFNFERQKRSCRFRSCTGH